jgi:hypothetical protein
MISAGSAALTSTAITYDSDTSTRKREESPDMYGMIPDTGRGVAFALMFSLAALQVLAKGISVALLVVTSKTWLVYYMGGDMLLCLLIKVMRRDFFYFMPLPLIATVPISVILRVATKMVADFTGLQHLRDPYQLGGAYYSFNQVSNFASVPVTAYLYLEYAPVDEMSADKLDGIVLWSFSISVIVLWMALFVFFIFRIIVKEYRKMFWSTRTSVEKAEAHFLGNSDDEKRMMIFSRNVLLWSRIKEDVRDWTMTNWEIWDKGKPSWFTPRLIARVPDDFIPPRFLAKLGGARERRGSAAESVREILRRGSADEGVNEQA